MHVPPSGQPMLCDGRTGGGHRVGPHALGAGDYIVVLATAYAPPAAGPHQVPIVQVFSGKGARENANALSSFLRCFSVTQASRCLATKLNHRSHRPHILNMYCQLGKLQ